MSKKTIFKAIIGTVIIFMAVTYTGNYNLGKQENKKDRFSMNVLTDNMDKLDEALDDHETRITAIEETVSNIGESAGGTNDVVVEEITTFASSVDNACFNVKTGGNDAAPDCYGRIVNVSGGQCYRLTCFAWNGGLDTYECALTSADFSQREYLNISGNVENLEIVVPNGFTKLIINYCVTEGSLDFSLKKITYPSVRKPYAGKKLVCLGDSITWGQCDGNGTQGISWASYMDEFCGFSNVLNCGVAGSSISGGGTLNTRSYQPFWNRYDEMSDDADVVIVWGGVNDFYLSGADFDEDVQSTDVDTFNGALNVLCTGLIEKYPSAKIVFITPMKCDTNLHFVNDNANPLMETFTANPQGYTLKDYVDKIKEVCDYHSIPVLDLYTSGCYSPYSNVHKLMFTADGLHPTNEGYKRIAERISQFLNNEI